MSPSDWLLLLVLSSFWGSSYFFIELLIVELPTLTIVAGRLLMAAIALTLFMVLRGQSLAVIASNAVPFAICGTLNCALPFALIVWGQGTVSAGLAGILNAMTPVFTALLATCFLVDEKLTTTKAIGIGITLSGVSLLVWPSVSNDADKTLPIIAVVGAALSYATAAVYSRRFALMGIPPITVATGQLIGGALIMVPIAITIEQPQHLSIPSPMILLVWACIALVNTALAYVVYFKLIASAGATNATLVTMLVPVWAVSLGAVFLGERLLNIQFLGMAVIGFGLLVLDRRLKLFS